MTKRTKKRTAALLAAAVLLRISDFGFRIEGSENAPSANPQSAIANPQSDTARLSQAEMDALAQERAVFVGAIRVKGTHRTRDRIIIQEILIKSGDAYDARKVEESRRLVQNLGIFAWVRLDFAPGEAANSFDMLVTVKERWTLLPDVQLTRKDSGRAVVGVKLKERNLFGLGQSLDVEFSKVGADDFAINLGWQGGVTFREPRLFGSIYSLAAGASRRLDFERIFDGSVILAEYASETDGAFLSVGRRFRPRHRVSLTASGRDIEYELFSGGPPRPDRALVSLGAGYAWERADQHPWFVLSGFVVEAGLGVHGRAFGSDLSSEGVSGGWRWYRRFGDFGVLRLRTAAAWTLSGDFDTFAQRLGGSDDVRGYADGQFRGMEKWFAGAEARDVMGRPFWKDRLLFGWAAFVDAGDAAFHRLDEPGEWKVGAGAGFRLYAQKIVSGVLSVDAAYGFDVHDWKILVSIGRDF